MPAKFNVDITPSAERDLEEIWDYIGQDSPHKADKFIAKLEKASQTLARFPMRCPLIPENEMLNGTYRHLLIDKYRLIFRLHEKKVFILRVIHGAKLMADLA